MISLIQKHLGLLLSFFATVVIVSFGWGTGLFGDNILFVQRFGSSLMDNGIFAWGSIPLEYDSGHPLLTASYLAFIWTLFGKTITVSHIALVPFIFIFFLCLWGIVRVLFDDIRWSIPAFILVVADPTVFCQLMYIGPEILVLCFSCLAVYGIMKHSSIYQVIGLMLLGVTTLRGMMLCAGIFLWDMFAHRKANYINYFVGAIPAVTFLIWRLFTKGWIISNPLSPWGSAFSYADCFDFMHNLLRNIVVFGSRIVDFGRIVPAIIVFSLLISRRKEIIANPSIKSLLLMTSLLCLPVAAVSLIIVNPMGHSYFLWIYIGMELLLVYLIQISFSWNKIIYGLSITALLLGNLIIYPERISQGWSCSLASLPYWSLRKEAFAYMKHEHISPQETLTFFPFGGCADDVEMNGDTRKYAASQEEARYVLASNICNLDDETLDWLQTCTTIKRFEKRGVHITLLQITP